MSVSMTVSEHMIKKQIWNYFILKNIFIKTLGLKFKRKKYGLNKRGWRIFGYHTTKIFVSSFNSV